MPWRASLPARMALVAIGFLSAVMLVLMLLTYAAAALLIRQGVDQALLTALPLTSGSLAELQEHAIKLEEEQLEHRHLRILDRDGRVLFGDKSTPVAFKAVAEALREGQAFAARAERKHRLEVRTWPSWWQALIPLEDEQRLLYSTWGERGSEVVLELAAPTGEVSEVLPQLFGWILVLAAAAILLIGTVVWRMAEAIYKPLRIVTAVAGGITTATLSQRIQDQWSDRTLAQMCNVFNGMIARLQESFETQGRFVAAAAHELRGPLSAMRTQLEVPLRRERTPAEYRRALEVALSESVRLGDLAEHLLILARFERGAGLLIEHDLVLGAILERAASEVRRSTGASIQVDAAADLTIDGDPIALERMVTNLIANGVEAGGAPILISAHPERHGIEITVSDQGKGIKPDALPHIFEPFYRADPARTRDRGTGLGLSIVKAVVDAHRGQVQVQSDPKQGTVVTVWLPQRYGS